MADRSDVELLEELLAREQRLLSAYEAALRRGAIDPTLGALMRAHEREHVSALVRSLPGGGARNPRASVPPAELSAALRDRESFARYALELEARTVGDYAGIVSRIRDAALRRPLGSIQACGAAHVVALRDSLGERQLVP